MTEALITLPTELLSITDFIRYGLTEANRQGLHYGHGTDNPMDDMVALILGTLHLPLDCDPILFQSHLTLEEKRLLIQQIHKRVVERVPVPYLIHQTLFCGLPFYVDERVLIPRSPIGELIQQQFSPWIDPTRVNRILDMCTGSACIAIACCYAFPDASVDAVDISPEALAVAEINRTRHIVQDQLDLIRSDCFDQVPPARYDLIIANPPYVGDEEMASLPPEYAHEPDLALRAARNGLAVVEKIMKQAVNYLTDDGLLVVEVGNSEEALTEAYPDLPLTWVDFENGGQGVFIITGLQLKNYW